MICGVFFGLVFFGDKDHFLDNTKLFDKNRITVFLEEKGIALSDTARSVKRLKDNASDKFLEVVEAADINTLLEQMPMCKAVVTEALLNLNIKVEKCVFTECLLLPGPILNLCQKRLRYMPGCSKN